MKNATILLTFSLLFSSCSKRINDYYSGIVIDELNRPLNGVFIREDYYGTAGSKSFTDKNGFFKFKRTGLPEIILSKNEYLNDTLEMIWHQHGETTEYSPIIRKDSTKLVLKSKNVSSLKFSYKKIENPSFDTITNYNFDENYSVTI